MEKNKIKYGKVELPARTFKEKSASIRISMMLPLPLYKELKRLAVSEEHEGKYQLLIKDILTQYVRKSKKSKKTV
ncbi:MAG: hypothetical protein ACK41T_06635 [Pseudobdellovibrio sp.]